MWSLSRFCTLFEPNRVYALIACAALSACGVKMNLELIPGTDTENIDAVSGYSLNLSSGNAQTGTVNASLGADFVVNVRDSGGNIASGVIVDWSVIGGGGSLSLPADTTDGAGLARTRLTLGTIAGANAVRATIRGTSITYNFSATGTAAAASQLLFVQQPSNVGAGSAISPSITVVARDTYGNLDASYATNVVMTIMTGANPGSSTLSGTTTRTPSSGVASFNDLSLNNIGTGYRLTATSGALSVDSTTFNVLAGAPSTIAVSSGNAQTGTVGAALGSSLVAIVRDAGGNPVSGVTVNWAVASGGGSVSAASSTTDASGLASIAFTLGTTAGANSATATINGTATSVTFTATGTAGTATQLAFVQQPSNAAAGNAISPSITVVARDAYNNTVTGYATNVVMTIATGSNPGSATLGGTTTRSPSSGVATFNDLTLNSIANGYQLTATSGALSVTSSSFDINAVSAGATITISSGNAQTGTVGTALGSAFVAVVRDSGGTALAGVTVNWAVASGGGSLSSASSATNGSGLSSSTLTLGTTAGANSVTATINGTATSVTFTATGTAGTATQLAFVQQPSNATAGTAISPAITVVARDTYNNTVTGYATNVVMTITTGSNPGSSTLSGTATQSPSSGIATFNDLSLNKVGTGYQLTATSGSLSVDSSTFNIAAGAASTIAISSGDGQSGNVSTALASAFVAVVRDANSNVVSGVTVDWAVTAGGGSLSSSSNATNASGLSSSTLTLGGSAGANTVTATINGSATSVTFTATAISPVTATFAGWTHVKSLGPVSPGAASPDLSTAAAATTVVWNAVTLSSGSVDTYNIYRSTSSGSETFATPLATGISASARSYTDSTVVAGTTYYYNIAPVQSGSVIVPAAAADREIKVITPPDNMVLVHRWIANQEMCGLMGLAIDRTQNYRCAFTGIGGTGTHFDLLRSIFVDRYETGVNVTIGAGKCGAASCFTINNGAPSSGTSGDIGYSRRRREAYYHNGTSWVDISSMNSTQLAAAFSSKPGLPPALLPQASADTVCKSQTISGFAGTKRMLRRKEFVLAAAWDSSLTDAQITTIENGVNLDTTHHCNTNYASPQGTSALDISGTNPAIAYDNTDYPAATNRDTLPVCRQAICSGTGSAGERTLRTGSSATNACVSRYGAQDLVGNVYEWMADQFQDNAGGTQTGKISSIDNVDDLVGLDFDDVNAPSYSNGSTGTSFESKIEFPHAIWVGGAAYSAAGVVNWSGTPEKFHGDALFVNSGEATTVKGYLSGGDFEWGTGAGRWASRVRNPLTDWMGFRCAFDAD